MPHRAERFLQSILDSLPSHIAVLDDTGTIIAVNRAWLSFGRANEAVQKHTTEGVNYLTICDNACGEKAEEAPLVATAIRNVLSGHQDHAEIEYPCHANGQQRWFVARVNRLYAEGPPHAVVVHEDITERKQLEVSRVRESQNLLQTFLDAIPAVIFAKDLEGRLTVTNQVFDAFFGAKPGEMLGKTDYDLFPTELADSVRAFDREVLASEQARTTESNVPSSEGTKTYLDIKFPIFTASGMPGGIGGFATDITERKQLETSLLIFQELIENAPDGIAVAGFDEIITYANPSLQQMSGYGQAVVGKAVAELYTQESQETLRRVTEMLQQHGAWQGNLVALRENGETFPVLASAFVVRDGEGEAVARAAIVRDITEQQRNQDELYEAKEAAEAANRAKSTFLANMSHELRTPLNAILGFAQLMGRSTDLPSEHRRHIKTIQRSGEHLLSLINNVLDLSKIEAGRTTLNRSSFDLYTLLRDIEELFQLRATEKRLRLMVEQMPDVPRYIVSDEIKLRQILTNILANAIKFTREGGVSLRVKSIPHLDLDACTLVFEVEDSGIGIARQELPTIFEAFSQTSSGKQAQESTGLGLSISYKFVELMGGTLQVSSTHGVGSLFRIELPMTIVDETHIQNRHIRQQDGILAEGQPAYRVLVVDDNEDNRYLVVNLLQPLGFELQEACNGQEALEIWQSWNPHFIWMDIRMPIMDGYETTRRIKATREGQKTIIVALTASSFEEERAAILASGCDDFVRKPFRDATILEIMKKHLNLQFVLPSPPDTSQNSPLAPTRITSAQSDHLVPGLVLTPEHIALLPPPIVYELEQALVETDPDRIDQAIEKIFPHDAVLASALSLLADDFEYTKIRDLVSRSKKVQEAKR